jgi:beta-lactamase class A
VTVKRPTNPRRRARQGRIARVVAGLIGGVLASIALWSVWGPSVGAPTENVATAAPPTVTAFAAALAAQPAATLGTTPVATLPPSAGRKALTAAELTAQIDALLAERDGRYSVVVELPGGAMEFSHLPNVPTEAASLYKLAIMVELYHEREEGWLSFDEEITLEPRHFLEDNGELFSIGETRDIASLLDQMITSSSNVAAAALLSRVGNLTINRTMADLGLTGTEIRWMPGAGLSAYPWSPEDLERSPDDLIYNVTTAADMGLLFRKLLDGEIVSPEASDEMLELLEQQQINDRLPVRLPANASVAHKTGNLDGLYHDVGVIYTPAGPAVVVVLTDDVEEFEAVGFMARLGELVYFALP